MKAGDYIRTKDGVIAKITDIIEDFSIDCDREVFHAFSNNAPDVMEIPYGLKDEYIIKQSQNILELLEEHDFITIEYYSLRYDERVTRIFEVGYKDEKFTTLKNAYCAFMLKNNEFNDSDKALEPIIKSIVTKEQFESMEYKIGE